MLNAMGKSTCIATATPLVSVILAVFNGENYIRCAIDSILDQTYTNFELIIIDDGSKDRTAEFISLYTDKRIVFVQQKNLGLSASLNKAIQLARGKYLARQDHDDISLPLRLEKQVAFMEDNPDYGMVGTHSTIWVENSPTLRGHNHPEDFPTLNFKLLFDSFFVHSSVMIRRSAVDVVGGYTLDKSRQPPEDFELWSRIIRCFKVANLPERLLIYREIPTSITRTVNFKANLIQISSENLAFMAGLDRPNADTWNIAALYHNECALLKEPFNYSSLSTLLINIGARVDKISPGGNACNEVDIFLRRFIGRLPPNLITHKNIDASRKIVRWIKKIYTGF